MIRLALTSIIAATLATSGCSQGLGRPLTPQEEAVQITTANQKISIKLAENCKPVGMDEMKDATEAEVKARAVEMGGNVAQMLYTTTSSSTTRMYGGYTFSSSTVTSDVRFWNCP